MAFLLRRWFVSFSVLLGIFALTPFLAPVLMELTLERTANAIYFIYSFFCHQLPQRSYFFFGQAATYSLAEIQDSWQLTTNPMVLRQFIGNPEMGWKVAWSDRMVSMFMSVWLISVIWYPLRLRIRALSGWGLALLLFPMALDGTSHFISDLAGNEQGFRSVNSWLAAITAHTLPSSFYAGDAWGSFNSLMRLLTGVLFGLGFVWFAFPRLERALFTEEA